MSAPRRRFRAVLLLVSAVLVLSALWSANTRPDLAHSRTVPTLTTQPKETP